MTEAAVTHKKFLFSLLSNFFFLFSQENKIVFKENQQKSRLEKIATKFSSYCWFFSKNFIGLENFVNNKTNRFPSKSLRI